MRCLACVVLLGLGGAAGAAGQTYHSGQNLQPVFEGWEQNADGSFNMVFGYLNRNYEEHLSIPVGPDNRFEPGDPDRGQPTFFYPRRQRIIFRVRVPADWGDRELVWTVTAHGRTDRAVGWLVPEQIIDEQVIAMNRAGGGVPEMVNAAPVIALVESTERSVRVGEPLTLTAIIRDDGVPEMRPRAPEPPARAAQRAGVAPGLDPVPRARHGGVRPLERADGGPHPGLDAAPDPRGRPHRHDGPVQRAGDLRRPGHGRRRLPLLPPPT